LCAHTHMYAHKHMYICMYVCMYMHVCMYVCIYVYMYTHTHTHTHTAALREVFALVLTIGNFINEGHMLGNVSSKGRSTLILV